MTAQESINNLIRELGIDKLPEDDQSEMLESIIEQLDEKVSMRLAERLTDQQFELYEHLMDDDSDAATADLKQLVPDYDEIVADEATKLKEQIKGMMP